MPRSALRGLVLAVCGVLATQAPAAEFVTTISAKATPVEAHHYPWAAVAKLNNGVGGSCSAVLISNKYALTAAHCLVLGRNQSFIPAEAIHLVFGYTRQQFSEHLHVRAYFVAPGFLPDKPYETLASDWALLELDTAGANTRPLSAGASNGLPVNSPLMTGGYSHEAPYIMSADNECRLLAHSKDQRFLFDTCRAPAGFSGSPVLVKTADQQYRVVGIHVANQMWQSNPIAVALPLDQVLSEIAPCIEKQDCKFQVVAQGREPTAAELLSGLPNLGR